MTVSENRYSLVPVELQGLQLLPPHLWHDFAIKNRTSLIITPRMLAEQTGRYKTRTPQSGPPSGPPFALFLDFLWTPSREARLKAQIRQHNKSKDRKKKIAAARSHQKLWAKNQDCRT